MDVDVLVLGGTVFLGGALLGSFLIRALGERPFSHLPDAYRERRVEAREWLERRNLLRLPGLCLVDSARPWILGESATVLFLAPAGFPGSGIGSIAMALPAAAAFGAGVLYLALRGEARRALLSVQRDLPVSCFLLSLLLESGMGPSAALNASEQDEATRSDVRLRGGDPAAYRMWSARGTGSPCNNCPTCSPNDPTHRRGCILKGPA